MKKCKLRSRSVYYSQFTIYTSPSLLDSWLTLQYFLLPCPKRLFFSREITLVTSSRFQSISSFVCVHRSTWQVYNTQSHHRHTPIKTSDPPKLTLELKNSYYHELAYVSRDKGWAFYVFQSKILINIISEMFSVPDQSESWVAWPSSRRSGQGLFFSSCKNSSEMFTFRRRKIIFLRLSY